MHSLHKNNKKVCVLMLLPGNWHEQVKSQEVHVNNLARLTRCMYLLLTNSLYVSSRVFFFFVSKHDNTTEQKERSEVLCIASDTSDLELGRIRKRLIDSCVSESHRIQ